MKILVADDDPVSARVLTKIIEKAGHECSVVVDGESAWKVASGPNPPRIMLLDWVMPGIDGIEVCRKIRALESAHYIYIFIISARGKHRDIDLGYQAGADDFITKPFRPQDVTSRLRVAERVISAQAPPQTLDMALAEACEAGGGDLIVRSGSVIGRIMIYHGKIAWAHISSEPGSLLAMLASEPTIAREDINAVLEECYATGANFAEVLVDWGLIDKEALRDRMRRWVRGKCQSIRDLSSPTILFSPEEREYSGGGFLLDLAEVLADTDPDTDDPDPDDPDAKPHAGAVDGAPGESPTPTIPTPALEVQENLDRAMSIPGVVGVTLFNSDTGETIGARGIAADQDFAWHNLRMVAAAGSTDTVEDIIVTTRRHLHILRLYARDPNRFLFVTTSRDEVKLGMLRLSLNDCTP